MHIDFYETSLSGCEVIEFFVIILKRVFDKNFKVLIECNYLFIYLFSAPGATKFYCIKSLKYTIKKIIKKNNNKLNSLKMKNASILILLHRKAISVY